MAAGQCWHWFDRPQAAREAQRLLVAGGALVICHRDYVVLPGNVWEATENLVLEHDPTWTMAGGTGIHPAWTLDVAGAGFVGGDLQLRRRRLLVCGGCGGTLSGVGLRRAA